MNSRITWILLLSILSFTPNPIAGELSGDRIREEMPGVLSFVSSGPQGALEERIAYLSKDISDGLTENQKKTIAVVEFSDLKGNVTDFGRFIAEELITRLHQTKKFQSDRTATPQQNLGRTEAQPDRNDRSDIGSVGKLLGVDAIASGTVTDLGKSLRVNARLIDTSTGEIFAVAASEIAKDDAVLALRGSSARVPTSDSDTSPEILMRSR